MARKKVTNALGDIFGQVDQYSIDVEHDQGERESKFAIDSIRPDIEQPRQLLPPDLYEQLLSGSHPIDILAEWLARAEQPDASTMLKQTIAELLQLAGTIELHGLINPITIRENREGPSYIEYYIVTGERRWWSHVYLTYQGRQVKESSPEEIRATIAPEEAIRAIQLIENMSRSDLTAYERAAGIQALYEELKTQGIKAPWGKVEELLNISRSYRTRILRVLKLDDEVQMLVQEYGLTEKAIRPITDKLLKQPKLQLAAVNQLLTWQTANEESGHARLNSFVDSLLKGKTSRSSQGASYWASKFGRQVNSTLKFLDALDDQEEAAMVMALAEDKQSLTSLMQLRESLDRVLNHLS